MKKINHPCYKQKDLHEVWSSDWGWLHIGDLVQVEDRMTGTGASMRGGGMVIGFFSYSGSIAPYWLEMSDEKVIVGVQLARDPSVVWFCDVERCKPAGAR